MKSFVSIRNLSYQLSNFELSLNTLEISEGEYYVIVGRTGSGKTVLLECLAGLKEIQHGTIMIDGQDMTNFAPEKRGIGFAYQDSLLFPFLSVRDNIWFSAKAKKLQQDESLNERFQYLIHQMGIDHLVDRYPRHLSGGEKQRVSLARALLFRPKLLLLDEPLSALDVNTRGDMSRLLQELHHNEGITVIHVTHDMSEALMLGTKMVVLQEGRMLEEGVPNKLYLRPKQLETAKFLGVENLIKAKVSSENEQLKLIIAEDTIEINPNIHLNEGNFILGIRSLYVQLKKPDISCMQWEVTLKSVYFNGQMLVLEGQSNQSEFMIHTTMLDWREYSVQIGESFYCYVKQEDILFYPENI